MIDAHAGSDNHSSECPREAYSRIKVIFVGEIPGGSMRAEASARHVENSVAIMCFLVDAVELIPQSQIQRQVRSYFPIILNVGVVVPLACAENRSPARD